MRLRILQRLREFKPREGTELALQQQEVDAEREEMEKEADNEEDPNRGNDINQGHNEADPSGGDS